MQSDRFSEKFLLSLSPDPLEGQVQLFHELRAMVAGKNLQVLSPDLIEVTAIWRAYRKSRGIDIAPPVLGPTAAHNAQIIVDLLTGLGSKAESVFNQRNQAGLLEQKGLYYESFFGQGQMYEFTDEEFSRIQQLINELRTSIAESKLIPDDHKRRLCWWRLEAMAEGTSQENVGHRPFLGLRGGSGNCYAEIRRKHEADFRQGYRACQNRIRGDHGQGRHRRTSLRYVPTVAGRETRRNKGREAKRIGEADVTLIAPWGPRASNGDIKAFARLRVP